MSDVRKAIAWSSRRSGVEGWSFKTLRATWATRASEIGIEPWLISEVLSHTAGGFAEAGAGVTQAHYVNSKFRHSDQKRAAMIRYADRLALELGTE